MKKEYRIRSDSYSLFVECFRLRKLWLRSEGKEQEERRLIDLKESCDELKNLICKEVEK